MCMQRRFRLIRRRKSTYQVRQLFPVIILKMIILKNTHIPRVVISAEKGLVFLGDVVRIRCLNRIDIFKWNQSFHLCTLSNHL